MRAGAVDCLTKPVDVEVLKHAVEKALREDARRRLMESHRRVHLQRLSRLTPRERQVLAAIVKGRLNKQIAGDLGTVEKTIKVHRARVMAKMKVHSFAELVHSIERFGIGPERPGVATQTASGLPHGLATWSWDIHSDLVTAHPGLASLFGIEAGFVAGLPLARYLAAIHPEDIDRVVQLIRASVASGTAYEAIYRVTPHGEDYRLVLARGRVEFDSDGSPARLPGALIDITEESRAALNHARAS
jgi:DNA-binding CsgD family transcriptional regulator